MSRTAHVERKCMWNNNAVGATALFFHTDAQVSGRFATGNVRHRKVRHKIGRFASALEGSPKCHKKVRHNVRMH